MALNKAVLKTRSLSAAVFVVLIFVGLFTNHFMYYALMCIILVGCLYEFVRLMRMIKPTGAIPYLLLSIPYIMLPILVLINLVKFSYNINVGHVQFNGEGYTILFVSFIFFCMWANDTMAYIVGSLIGKTKFSSISPNKTWEGTLGGIVLCTLAMGFAGKYLASATLQNGQLIPIHHWYILAFICAVFGTLGDLVESYIKRKANVKDSGTLMPGHGGFLDRFDSLLFATPFVGLYILLCM